MVASIEQELFVRIEMENFLYMEAELLDDGRLREWLELCAHDIEYKLPVRLSRERAYGDGNSTTMMHWDDDYAALEMRILRVGTEYAWAEDPPSRIRRCVSNVRVRPVSDSDEYDVRSNLLLYRSRGDSEKHDLLAGERHDRIRRTEEGLRLASRRIVLDQAVIGTHSLSFFL